jgi:hypothetical protein
MANQLQTTCENLWSVVAAGRLPAISEQEFIGIAPPS